MAKLGLGKGLGALLSEAEDEVDISSTGVPFGHKESTDSSSVSKGGEILVDINLLKPNPHQPRVEFDADALQELSESIKEHGVIQPVLVEEDGSGGYYIIAGERRTRASRLAGLTQIPVLIKKYSEELKLEIALIENIQRENLNAVEEAKAYQKLMEMGQLNQDEVAHRVGKNRSTVANALRLLKLPEDMQSSLASGAITAGHARALLSVINPSDQRILFGRIIGQGMSVRDAEASATELNSGGKAKSVVKTEKKEITKDPDLAFIEQQFIDKLGTKVAIKGDFDKGSIQIDYFNRDDLDRLLTLIISD